MTFSIETVVVLHMEKHKEDKLPHLKAVDLNIFPSKPLDQKMYHTAAGVPNESGGKAITAGLVHGLIANVKHCHAEGYRNEVEHIKSIIEQLSVAFATNADISENEFKRPSDDNENT